MSATATVSTRIEPQPNYLERLGTFVLRYGLVLILIWIGALKFTAAEAAGIRGLIEHSPFMSWMYKILTVQMASNLIGVTELAIAILIAMRPRFPLLSLIGSFGGIITFVITLSFLLSTPGALTFVNGAPILDGNGQFLIKDVILLGASLFTAGEAKRAIE